MFIRAKLTHLSEISTTLTLFVHIPPYFTQNLRNNYDGFYATFSSVISDVSMQYGVNYATFAFCPLFSVPSAFRLLSELEQKGDESFR